MRKHRPTAPLGLDPFEKAILTPGPLGHNDAASPDSPRWWLGYTPGPLGHNDFADPVDEIKSITASKQLLPSGLPSHYSSKQRKVMTPTSVSGERLSEDDFRSAAKALGDDISVSIIRAFAEVESGGRSGFGRDGLPVIAYEGHIFRRLTHGKYDGSHPFLSYRYVTKAGLQWRHNNRSHVGSWETVCKAIELDFAAALQACSWGMFQVMGFNYKSCGFADVESFVTSMKAGERGQLDAFVGFCKGKQSLVNALANKDFKKIAYLYNWQDFGNYDKLLE